MSAAALDLPSGIEQDARAIQDLLSQRDALLDALCTALSFVEDALDDRCFVRGWVQERVGHIRRVIESVDDAIKASGPASACICATRAADAPSPATTSSPHGHIASASDQ